MNKILSKLSTKMISNTYNIEILIIIFLVIVIVIAIKIHFKKLESFVAPNKNDVISEIDKQLNIMRNARAIKAEQQVSSYLPHLDLINQYKGKSNQFLDTIENNVSSKLEKQKSELGDINNYIRSLARYKEDDFLNQLKNADFKSVKSHNNGLSLNINRLGYDKYQVMMNNGCLKVISENDYNIVPCDLNDKGQEFKLEHVFNEKEYRGSMDKAFPQISNLGKVHYPMTMIKSSVNDNCVKNYHGNITVEPCREYEGQRWASSKNINKCASLF
jgi:hypothetical protein